MDKRIAEIYKKLAEIKTLLDDIILVPTMKPID